MPDFYQPTEDELDRFDADLNSYADQARAAGDVFGPDDLRLLAQTHWPDKHIRVRAPSIGIHEPVDYHPPTPPPRLPATPAPVAQQTPPSSSPPAEPERPPGRPVREKPPAVQQARREFADRYGAGEGVKVVTGANHEGLVIRADGEVVTSGQRTGDDVTARVQTLLRGEAGASRRDRVTAWQQQRAEAADAAAETKTAAADQVRSATAAAVAEAGEPVTWDQLRGRAGRPRPVTR